VEGAEEAGVARRCRRRRSAGDGHWVGNGRPGGGPSARRKSALGLSCNGRQCGPSNSKCGGL
jgi:hypothetical protein